MVALGLHARIHLVIEVCIVALKCDHWAFLVGICILGLGANDTRYLSICTGRFFLLQTLAKDL